jgi:hypothetical protein
VVSIGQSVNYPKVLRGSVESRLQLGGSLVPEG